MSGPANLPEPAATPRQFKSGRQERDKPIYRQWGGEGLSLWEVEVTPLTDTTSLGRSLTGGRLRPRAIFEVRAAFFGTGSPAFGSQSHVRRRFHMHAEDQELARAIARAYEELLRNGQRDWDFMAVARDVERRRVG